MRQHGGWNCFYVLPDKHFTLHTFITTWKQRVAKQSKRSEKCKISFYFYWREEMARKQENENEWRICQANCAPPPCFSSLHWYVNSSTSSLLPRGHGIPQCHTPRTSQLTCWPWEETCSHKLCSALVQRASKVSRGYQMLLQPYASSLFLQILFLP